MLKVLIYISSCTRILSNQIRLWSGHFLPIIKGIILLKSSINGNYTTAAKGITTIFHNNSRETVFGFIYCKKTTRIFFYACMRRHEIQLPLPEADVTNTNITSLQSRKGLDKMYETVLKNCMSGRFRTDVKKS